jgi:hypothetical protein
VDVHQLLHHPLVNLLNVSFIYIYTIILLNFLSSELDCRLELIQLKEENKLLEEVTDFLNYVFVYLFHFLD